MWTSGEIPFRLKLKITLPESTYPSQRPQCPSLSPHFLLKMVYERVQAWLVFRVDCTGVIGFDKPALAVFSKKSPHCIYMYLGTQTSSQ